MTKQMVPWVGDPPPASWDLVEWPDWVPKSVREQIASFWGPACGRRPKDYLESVLYPHLTVPGFGERVFLGDGDSSTWVVGRYVHAWNNMGRVVTDSGRVACVSCNNYGRPIPDPKITDRQRLDYLTQLLDANGYVLAAEWTHDGRRSIPLKMFGGREALLVHRFADRSGENESLRQAIDAVLLEGFRQMVRDLSTETTNPAQPCNGVQRASEDRSEEGLNPHKERV